MTRKIKELLIKAEKIKQKVSAYKERKKEKEAVEQLEERHQQNIDKLNQLKDQTKSPLKIKITKYFWQFIFLFENIEEILILLFDYLETNPKTRFNYSEKLEGIKKSIIAFFSNIIDIYKQFEDDERITKMNTFMNENLPNHLNENIFYYLLYIYDELCKTVNKKLSVLEEKIELENNTFIQEKREILDDLQNEIDIKYMHIIRTNKDDPQAIKYVAVSRV